jgi:hypothetical protein
MPHCTQKLVQNGRSAVRFRGVGFEATGPSAEEHLAGLLSKQREGLDVAAILQRTPLGAEPLAADHLFASVAIRNMSACRRELGLYLVRRAFHSRESPSLSNEQPQSANKYGTQAVGTARARLQISHWQVQAICLGWRTCILTKDRLLLGLIRACWRHSRTALSDWAWRLLLSHRLLM